MFTRLVSCRRGVVSVEAAFVFPVLVLLVVGGMEFALMLFTYNSMQNAAREVTRQIAVNFTGEAQVADAVVSRLPQWSQGAATVAVTQSDPGDPETNVIRVRISMPAGDATPVRFFTRMSEAWDLQTEVAMKQELPL